MPNHPCILCDKGCVHYTQPIWLPLTIPPKIDPHQLLWPLGDWYAFLECPSCGRVLRRSAKDVRWEEMPMSAQTSLKDQRWFLVAYECAIENCGTPIEFHVLRDATVRKKTEFEISQKLQTEPWTGASPCGHTIGTTTNQQVGIVVNEQTIPGYRPPTLRLERPVSLNCPMCHNPSWAYTLDWFQVGKRIECYFCGAYLTLTEEIVKGLATQD